MYFIFIRKYVKLNVTTIMENINRISHFFLQNNIFIIVLFYQENQIFNCYNANYFIEDTIRFQCDILLSFVHMMWIAMPFHLQFDKKKYSSEIQIFDFSFIFTICKFIEKNCMNIVYEGDFENISILVRNIQF